MFALGIRYLNGWAMATTDGANKERAEWPPHPDRVFMALAAAWFETGKDKREGEALEWLEKQNAPDICASEAFNRQGLKDRRPMPVISYVPVNDSKIGKKISDTDALNNLTHDKALKKLKETGLSILPEYRSRKPRRFPVAIPWDDRVHLIWPESEALDNTTYLARLCRNVVSIGHSASFVLMWVEENPPATSLVPIRGMARHRLRVFGPGRLKYLEQRCNREAVIEYADLTSRITATKGKEKKQLKLQLEERFKGNIPISLRPEPGLWQGYDSTCPTPKNDEIGSLFDPRIIVLKISSRKLPLSATLKITEALRGIIMSQCPDQPPPEWLSGHTPKGGPSNKTHMALVPLPFTGSEHADGGIMGLSLVLPRSLSPEETGRCLNTILHDNHGLPRRIKLFNGRWFECEAEIDIRETPPFNLRPDTWTSSSKVWASVTPVVLDRHFRGPDMWDKASNSVKDSCERIKLPRPAEAILQPVSLIEGAPHAREFPGLTRKKDGSRMYHTHATLVFHQNVRGPLLVGAGRYRGYGLFRPLTSPER